MSTSQAHAIENSSIEHERHGMSIDGLNAERPHEGALGEIQAGGNNGGSGLIALQDSLQRQLFGGAQKTAQATALWRR